MTYSIVAYDPEEKQIGVAVQSHSPCVGAVVCHAEAGIGAIATQARSDGSQGTLGLTIMRTGKSPQQTLKAILASDREPDIRQIAIVDKQGNIAVNTGKKCVEAAGHRQGKYYSVQANMMLKNTVWDAMAEAFETSNGSLAQRMLKALFAAESEEGDIRGQQSAALIVVSSQATNNPTVDRLFDLRVDDSETPLEDLEKLLKIARSNRHRRKAIDLLLDSSLDNQKFELAGAEFSRAIELLPNISDNRENAFWYGITLASLGKVEDASPWLKRVFAVDPNWRELGSRLIKAGVVSDNKGAIAQLMQQI